MKKINLIKLDTGEEFSFDKLHGLGPLLPLANPSDYNRAASQVKNLVYGLAEVVTIFGSPFCLKGSNPKKYEIKDLLTGKIFTAYFKKDLARDLGITTEETFAILNGKQSKKNNNSSFGATARYVNLGSSKTFFLVDYFSGEEYECSCPRTFFLHLGIPFDKLVSNGLCQVKREGGSFSCDGRVFYMKGLKPNVVRPFISRPPEVLKQMENNRIQKKLRGKLRDRLASLIKKDKLKKACPTLVLLGCSLSVFKEHLENQFQDGMGWENHGMEHINGERSWQIDHIQPCNTFDLTDPEQQKICFHYTNLRPLWQDENIRRPKDGSDISFDPFNN